MVMIHMELQLGLALPSASIIHGKGLDFDLNNSYYVHEPSSCDFGGSGSVRSKCSTNNNDDMCNDNRKRRFGDAFEFEQVRAVVPPTLSLLNWNKHPGGDEDDHPKDLDNNSSFGSNKTTDEDGVVGWPPIKNLWKKLCYQHHAGGGRVKNNQTVANANSMFVKVKMEGAVIARKIDLSLYNSFETLTSTLITMFGLWNEDSQNYQLTYQDRGGVWQIAQEVPWRTFIRTAKRLKLSKLSC